ncbi:MAG: energy-coupling factor transporter transmembrane component T [Nibricoccus sp.]
MSGIHFGHNHTPYAPEFRQTAAVRVPLPWLVPGAKLAIMLVLVVGTALMPLRWWTWHVFVLTLLAAAITAGRVPLKPLLWRVLWLSPFVAGTALATAWHGTTGPGWPTIAVRGSVCLITVLVFAAITPFGALPGVLRKAGVPSLLVTTMALMHRYLFVLVDESNRMRRARACRTLARSRGFRWSMPADVVGRLFIRASERAERIYLAMCARGWK